MITWLRGRLRSRNQNEQKIIFLLNHPQSDKQIWQIRSTFVYVGAFLPLDFTLMSE
jgi:hypothetical protein